MGTLLNKIIFVVLIFLTQNVWSTCQNQELYFFSSIEDLMQLAFQDCTTTKNDNRQKCLCQKHNSKIIPDASAELLDETKNINMDEVKKHVQGNIDEMIQYFLALESNIELSNNASESCSLARLNKIHCTNSKKPIVNQIYPQGTQDLLKQSQCQLKQKYNIPCDKNKASELKKSSSCIDEGTRLAMVFKERESATYLSNFQQRLSQNTVESIRDEVHPSLKLILNDPQLKNQFLKLPSHQLHSFIKSPMITDKISIDIAKSCEQKLQNMQSLLCSEVSDLQQVPLKNIIRTEKALIKQNPRDLNEIVKYQQQLNLFCQNLERPSLEKTIMELNKIAMPTKFSEVLATNELEHAQICKMLNPPLSINSIAESAKTCHINNQPGCSGLKTLFELYQSRESTTNHLANHASQSQDSYPSFFSKQLKIFFGENLKPTPIDPLPEGKKVSVANYHEELFERDQARSINQSNHLLNQPNQNTKSVATVAAHSVIPTSYQTASNDFEFHNNTHDSYEVAKHQNNFIENERKNNSQIMKHFQNINQKQIDMIEKMANKIILDNHSPESEINDKMITQVNPSNQNATSETTHADKQPTIKVGGSAKEAESQGKIVYIDNSNSVGSERFSKPTIAHPAPSETDNDHFHSTTNIVRGLASQDENSQSQQVEVIHKDQTQHKKYDEIIISLDIKEGDKLSNLKPHELEKISKYLEEKRPFILKKISKDQKSSKNIDATILVGDKLYITIIPNKKITEKEQQEYLLIKKELEKLMKFKLSQNNRNATTISRL